MRTGYDHRSTRGPQFTKQPARTGTAQQEAVGFRGLHKKLFCTRFLACRTEQSVAANIAHLPQRHGAQRAVIHTAPAVGPTMTHRGSDTLSKGDCWLMGRGIGVLATFAFGRQV